MTKFGWIVTLLVLGLIGTVVGGVIFFTTRTKPEPQAEQVEEVIPTPAEVSVNPATSTASVASSTQASSSPQ